MNPKMSSSGAVLKEGLLVGTGAALGAVARYLLTVAFGDTDLTILVVNILACLAMGFFLPGPFWGKGFLAGFSTFSAVAAALSADTFTGALVHATVMMAACVSAVLLAGLLREGVRR